MSDIVSRLRDRGIKTVSHSTAGWLFKAANEIERLQARIDELEKVIREHNNKYRCRCPSNANNGLGKTWHWSDCPHRFQIALQGESDE